MVSVGEVSVVSALCIFLIAFFDFKSWSKKKKEKQKMKHIENTLNESITDCVYACTLCDQEVTIAKQDYCMLTRVDTFDSSSSIKSEIYHVDCFKSIAGEDIYNRLQPKSYECAWCKKKKATPGDCKECEQRLCGYCNLYYDSQMYKDCPGCGYANKSNIMCCGQKMHYMTVSAQYLCSKCQKSISRIALLKR